MRREIPMLMIAVLVAVSCGARIKHYSFSNGYPANGAVSSASAQAVANGGASMTATTRKQQGIVRTEKSIVGRVTKVASGDTITVTPSGGRGKKVRLRRISVPKADGSGGDRATAFLAELIGGKDVEVKYAECDAGGRVLGTVFFKSEKGMVDANLTMVLNGWARHGGSSKAADTIPAYDKAEQAARNAKVGLWAEDAQAQREPGP